MSLIKAKHDEELLRDYMKAPVVMLTEEESKAICPRCKRLQSLMENISYAWDNKDEVPDGYSRLKFSIELMESERIR